MKKVLPLFLIFLLVLSCLTACTNPNAERIDWKHIVLGNVLPEPQSNLMNILYNNNENLNVYIYNISENQFLEYIAMCEEAGYTIDSERISSNSFKAFNQNGYLIDLYYSDSQNELHINLDAPMEMNEFQWPINPIAELLPIPKSDKGVVQWERENGFLLYVGNTPVEDYQNYVSACIQEGFTIDSYKSDKVYYADNADGYHVILRYEGFDIISIKIDAPDNSTPDNVIALPKSSKDYAYSNYQTVISDLEQAGFTNIKTEIIYDLILGILVSDGEVESISIGGTTDFSEGDKYPPDAEIIVTYHTWASDEPNTDPDTSITVTMEEDEFLGMHYTEAETMLRDMGFTVFEYKVLETSDSAKSDNTISAVEIKSWAFGKGDFSKGDTYESDAIVVLWYYDYKEPEKPGPVFYSTNDYETAKNGNTGVFSYKSKGSSYDIYWIIDFDEGYVYYFTDGDGESFCDRLKIESGDLNSFITITYHDGGTVWSYKLHFKYVNHPETLIMVDQNGFDYTYSTTDLAKALNLLSTKNIKDY